MKKILFLLFLTLILTFQQAFAQKPLEASISLVDKLPPEFFGTWHVVSIQKYCSNPLLNTPYSVDIWNISRLGNVITLTNPQTGATASVKIDEVNGNSIKFTRIANSNDEHVVETPNITINGENFVGTDKIVIENYKFGEHASTDVWLFNVKAKKISGASTKDLLKR